MKLLKKFLSAIIAAITVYLAASGLVSLFKDSGRFLATRKS